MSPPLTSSAPTSSGETSSRAVSTRSACPSCSPSWVRCSAPSSARCFLAARFGGIVDDAINCGIDFTASLPFIILALTIIAFLGTDVTVIIVIMAVYGWDRYARLTRNLSRSAYTEGYACALEGLGLPTVSIALRHILPNIASALVVNMTLNFPGMILLETSLSFLGVGVQPPMSSLGTMLGFGRDYLTTAWWTVSYTHLTLPTSQQV